MKTCELNVAAFLNDLGFDWHLLGTLYLSDILVEYLGQGDDFLLNPAMKVTFPQIAKRYNTTSLAVERSIRYAIEAAFLRSRSDYLFEVFSRQYPKTGRPSVLHFIHTAGRYLLLKNAQKSDAHFDKLGNVK